MNINFWEALMFTAILYFVAGNILALGWFIDPKSRRKKGLLTNVISYIIIVIFWPVGLTYFFD